MDELNLNKAIANRDVRKQMLSRYNNVSEAISKFHDEGFCFLAQVKMWERGVWIEIYPSPEEIHDMLLKMRERYDVEITKLDKEFAEL